MDVPKLTDSSTGEENPIYWESQSEKVSDGTVIHKIPNRDGDIQQNIGHGSLRWTGTILITPSMDDNGVKGFRDFLRNAARSESTLEYTDVFGVTHEVSLKEPEFDKAELPNLLKANIEIVGLDNPVV